MRSRHADAFNHDPWSENYDVEVRDETNPIRAGYTELLRWTLEQARIDADSAVLDLGAGTGNSVAGIPEAGLVACVDVSEKMLAQAPVKLAHLPKVEYHQADLLEVFERDLPLFDAVISTYSVHHLTEEEKADLFRRVFAALRPGGRAVFGDLMFEDEAARQRIADAWSDDDHAQVLISVEDEFPWFLDHARESLTSAGFLGIEVKQFSTLSWGLVAEKPA